VREVVRVNKLAFTTLHFGWMAYKKLVMVVGVRPAKLIKGEKKKILAQGFRSGHCLRHCMKGWDWGIREASSPSSSLYHSTASVYQ